MGVGAALPFFETFDHYTTVSQALRKWTVFAGTLAASGRTGRGANVNGVNAYISKTFNDAPYPTLAAGLAINTPQLQGSPIIFSNALTEIRAECKIISDGRLQIVVTNGNTLSSSGGSLRVINVNTWYHISFSATHNKAAGTITCELRLNNEIILTHVTIIAGFKIEEGFASFQPTLAGGGYSTGIVDDIWVTTGAMLGDARGYVIYPDGDVTTDWDQNPVSGSHFDKVNETNPNDFITYISTPTTTKVDLFTLQDIVLNGIIVGIQANIMAQKSDGGDAAFKFKYKFNGTPYDGYTDHYPSYLTWLDFTEGFETNPATGIAFTNAEINAIQLGIERTI
jgi:hypothetical protein